VELKAVRDINPVSVLQHSYIIIENPDASCAILSHRVGGKGKEGAATTEAPKKRVAKKAKTSPQLEQRGDQ
jgi:hypothetical protein